MIAVPAFGSGLRAVPVPGAGALLLHEDGHHLLPGAAYAVVVPLVDGARTSEEIVAEAMRGGLDAAVAWYALQRLESSGYLIDGRADVAADVAAFWSGLGVDPAAAVSALRAARVRVHATGSVDATDFTQVLEQCGICCADEAAAPGAWRDLDVVLARDYLDEALLPFDAAARSASRRWLLVRPLGFELWIGPLFEPGRTGCLHCLRHKLGRYRRAHLFAAELDPGRGVSTPLATLPAATEAAHRLAAVEVARTLAGVGRDLAGILFSIDLRDRSAEVHRLLRRPECSACGSGPGREPAPVRLDPGRHVTFDADGGYRTALPEETLEKYGHVASPITGIVPGLTGLALRQGVGFVYMAEGPARLSLDGNGRFRGGRMHNAGKGMTEAQARASALGESIERYSAELQGTESVVSGSFRGLGDDAIHPNAVMRFSDRQYRDRERSNAAHGRRRFVPEPFDEDARIDWSPLWSLTNRRQRLLPTELLFYDVRSGGAPRYCLACSNGCASGNTMEEAVLQGLLELIERDSVAIWWYNRLRLPAIDPASFDDKWLSAVPGHYDALGRDIVVLDLTGDLRIPVAACISRRRASADERILLGFGCHVDARIAVQRAVSEMGQMLAADLGACDSGVGDPDYESWIRTATLENHAHLAPDEAAPPRTRSGFPRAPRSRSVVASVDRCRRAVESRGLEVLVLDQTRRDIGMPTARVVVPGLRHMWARFGRGRLYDVPVAAGLLDSPTAESDLNPIPFFF